MKNYIYFILPVFLTAAFAVNGNAEKLSVTAELLIQNVVPGETYSLKAVANAPLRLTNDTDQAMEIKVAPILPDKAFLRKGYIPVPSISWIKIEQDKLVLAPHQVKFVDVLISVPKSAKYLNKMYQAHIWFQSVPKRNSGVQMSYGLESIILIKTIK